MLKDALKWMASAGGPAHVARQLRRGRTLVLAYHNIVPVDAPVSGELPLHLPQDVFAEQLDVLTRTHEVISLEEAFRGPSSHGGRPRAVLTFDDAYHGALTVGIEEVVRRELPATLFVAPEYVGGKAFWWDVLRHPDNGEEWTGFRERALSDLAGREDPVRRLGQERGFRRHAVPRHQRCVTEEELTAAVQCEGITVGAHGWSHVDLTRLGPEELMEELRRPVRWLGERFGDSVLPWIAYPYGTCSDAVERAAERAGYLGGFALSDTCWIPRDPYSNYGLPRFSIPRGMSRADFVLTVSGL